MKLCVPSSSIRLLTERDVPGAMRLKHAAGWNQTEDDWLRLLKLEPNGCFCLECAGVMAATTTIVHYRSDPDGPRLGWLGMVLTAPEFRGRGLARRLVAHTLDYSTRQGAAWLKLDGTSMGEKLYSKLGFSKETEVERWLHPGSESHGRASRFFPPVRLDGAQLARDWVSFGASRQGLLRKLGKLGGKVMPRGYAMWRPGSSATYFGPCVAEDERSAEQLLWLAMDQNGPAPLVWDLFPANAVAVRIARSNGFRPVRSLARMSLQLRPETPAISEMRARIFAIAGFEYG